MSFRQLTGQSRPIPHARRLPSGADERTISSRGPHFFHTGRDTEHLLRGAADLQTGPHNPGGCLTVNGAIACGDEAEPVRRALKAHRTVGLAIGQVTGITFNSTGTRAYITSAVNLPGSVVVVDTGTYQKVTTYTVGTGPTDVAISYDDGWLIVNNSGGNSISIIDLSKGTVTTTTVGGSPSGIAFVN